MISPFFWYHCMGMTWCGWFQDEKLGLNNDLSNIHGGLVIEKWQQWWSICGLFDLYIIYIYYIYIILYIIYISIYILYISIYIIYIYYIYMYTYIYIYIWTSLLLESKITWIEPYQLKKRAEHLHGSSINLSCHWLAPQHFIYKKWGLQPKIGHIDILWFIKSTNVNPRLLNWGISIKYYIMTTWRLPP